jgi:hypothetical protein
MDTVQILDTVKIIDTVMIAGGATSSGISSDTVILLIAAATLFVTTIGATIAIMKFLFDLKKEVANLEINTTKEIAKLSSKFDVLDERYKTTNVRVDKMEIEIKEFATVKEDL